jgi:hypothetical protein
MRSRFYVKNLQYQSFIGSTIHLDEENRFHKEAGPAIIETDGDKYWFKHGKLHRLDGPASEFADGGKEWFIEDEQIPCFTQEEFEKYLKLKLFW